MLTVRSCVLGTWLRSSPVGAHGMGEAEARLFAAEGDLLQKAYPGFADAGLAAR
jgi:hypothetical protein